MKTQYRAQGQWIESKPYSTEGRWEVNYSDILSQLIKSAGRYCERYASDLFIDWNVVVKELENGAPMDKSYIFAFRDSGVDHKEYYENRKASPEIFGEPNYHEVWELKVKSTDNDRWLEMELNLIAN